MIAKRGFIGLIITMICVSSNVYSSDKIYKTNFPLTEDRISEGEIWINGAATGIDWTNVKTSNGSATGTQVRDVNYYYDDSVAILKGTWGPDQTAEAIVYSANQYGGGASGWDGNEYSDCNKEVELILRGDITAHSIFLYEINFSSRKDGNGYSEIGKWTGARGVFNQGYLSQKSGSDCGEVGCGVTNGDVVKATIVGNTIKVYKNNVLINTATDTTDVLVTGKPGIAFYSSIGCTGTAHNDDFGFTSYTASAPETRIPKSPAIISISP